jgi:hypothetical protein
VLLQIIYLFNQFKIVLVNLLAFYALNFTA